MPLALYQVLQSIFKIFDALLASHIGAEAVSAVSCLSQITLMITALGSGLAIGGSIKISEAYGRGDDTQVRQRVATVYAMAVLVSLVVAGTLIPFAPAFLRLLKTPEDLIIAGVGYFRVEILTLVVTFFNTVYIAIERSRGHAKKILNLNLVIILVNLYLGSTVFTLKTQGKLLYTTLNNLKAIASPFALLVLGGQFEFSAVRGLLKEIVAGTLWRIVLAPLLGIGGAILLSGFSGYFNCGINEYPALIAMFGSPVAVSSAVMAGSMGGDEQLATQLVVWTSLLSIVTVFTEVCILMSMGLLSV